MTIDNSKSWRVTLAGGLLLAVLLCIAYFDVIFLGRTFQTAACEGVASLVSDMPWGYPGERILNFDIPVQDPGSSAFNEEVAPHVVNRAIRSGRMPFWNPFVGCGTPLAAHPITSTFYPLAWITHLAPGAWSWDLFLLLRLWIAGFFTFLFLRELKLGFAAAFAGGAFFMLSGYMTRYVNLFHINVECLVPAAFWAIERFRQKQTSHRFTILVIVLLAVILGGNPQSHVMLFATLFAWGIFSWAWGAKRNRKREIIQSAIVIAGAITLASLLSAFFLLPFLEFYKLSIHPHRPTTGTDFLAIFQTITLLSPNFYHPLYLRYLTFPTMYMGVGVTLLCVFCVPREKNNRPLAFFLLGAITLLYCKLTGFWFINWIGQLPILKYFIFRKYMSELYFFIAMAGALGLDNILRRRVHIGWARLGFILYCVAIVALYFRNLNKIAQPFERDPIRIEMIYTLLRLGFLALLIMMGMYLSQRKRFLAISRALLAGVALFGIVELLVLMNGQHALRYNVFTPSPNIKRLQTERLAEQPWDRVYAVKTALFPQSAAALGLQDARDFSVLSEKNYWQFMKTHLTNQAIPTYFDSYFSNMFTGSSYPEVIFSPYFNLLGTRYVLSTSYLNIPNFHDYLIKSAEFRGNDGAEMVRGFRNDYFYISTNSPSSFDIEVDIPENGDTLLLDPVVDFKEFWLIQGGIIYRVFVTDSKNEKHLIFEDLENPHIWREDRILQTHEISLNKWAGQTVTLTFQVEGDIRNGNSLKCLWRDLYLKSWEKRVRSNFKLLYDGEINIYENSDALPRAFITHRAILSPDEITTHEIMTRGRFDSTREVIMEYQSDNDLLKPLLDSGDYHLIDNTDNKLQRFTLEGAGAEDRESSNLSGNAQIESYEMDRVTISAMMMRPGFLILSDTFYPGWRAYIDGNEAPIFRANGFLRAIPLAVGQHKVEFRYVPATFFIGLSIALATLLGWLGVRFFIRLRRKSQSQ